MSMPRRRGVGQPPRPERFRIPPGWAPVHMNISPEASAIDLLGVWRALETARRYAEAREVLGHLQAMAERPPPGKRFPVKRRR